MVHCPLSLGPLGVLRTGCANLAETAQPSPGVELEAAATQSLQPLAVREEATKLFEV